MAGSGRAAVFSPRFGPWSQTFVYDEVRAHSRYEVDVFCRRRLNPDEFPCERVHEPAGPLGRLVYGAWGRWPPFDRILAQRGHDLIHAHFGPGAVYALPFVERHGHPFIVTFWGNDVGSLVAPRRPPPSKWRYLRVAPRILARADLMLCVSETLRGRVAELSGRPEATRLYHHGVDLSRFAPVERENDIATFVLVGRFTEKKGHRYAIEALERLIRGGRRARLVLIGAGALEKSCRALVRERSLDEHVVFRGRLSHGETAAAVARSDVALVPSVVAADGDIEGSPTVIREAAACGLPVIGTLHSGIPELIDDGRTGYLVPERDVAALADRMADLLDDPARRRAFGQAARTKMEEDFDLHRQVSVLEDHYDSVRR